MTISFPQGETPLQGQLQSLEPRAKEFLIYGTLNSFTNKRCTETGSI
jgi:hypothetical protein